MCYSKEGIFDVDIGWFNYYPLSKIEHLIRLAMVHRSMPSIILKYE